MSVPAQFLQSVANYLYSLVFRFEKRYIDLGQVFGDLVFEHVIKSRIKKIIGSYIVIAVDISAEFS